MSAQPAEPCHKKLLVIRRPATPALEALNPLLHQIVRETGFVRGAWRPWPGPPPQCFVGYLMTLVLRVPPKTHRDKNVTSRARKRLTVTLLYEIFRDYSEASRLHRFDNFVKGNFVNCVDMTKTEMKSTIIASRQPSQ